jgi:hypothetical protein
MKILVHTHATLIAEHRPVFYWVLAAVFTGGLPAILAAASPREWLLGSAISALAGVLVLVTWGRISTVTFDRARRRVAIVRRAPWGTERRVFLGLDEIVRVSLDTRLHRARVGDILLYSVVLESTLGERIALTSGECFRQASLSASVEAIRAFLRPAC